MKKIKKIFVSFIAFFIGIANKIYVWGAGVNTMVLQHQDLYGPPPTSYKYDDALYGPPREEIDFQNKMKLFKILSPILLLIIGIGVLINKKLSKKVKAIIIGILVLLGIGIYFFKNI